MLNRYVTATSSFARRKASESAAWAVFVRDTISGFITTAHHTLMLLGITAIAALGIMFVRPEIADQLKALSPFASAKSAVPAPVQQVALAEGAEQQPIVQEAAYAKPVALAEKSTASLNEARINDGGNVGGNARQQKWVTEWLSKRYRVAADATNMLVSAAYLTAKEIKLDPLLILSVVAIESRFNPFAESPVGAQGLMQVMSKVHHDKFEDHGGVKAALNPVANIKVGSQILKEYVTRGGSIEAGLKLYVGAGAFENDDGYGAKVLAEYRRLKDVAMGKKVPVYSASASASATAAPAKPRAQETKSDTSGASESASANGKGKDHAVGSDGQVAAL